MSPYSYPDPEASYPKGSSSQGSGYCRRGYVYDRSICSSEGSEKVVCCGIAGKSYSLHPWMGWGYGGVSEWFSIIEPHLV